MEDLFFFDIETCGQYRDYNTFLLEDPRGSELFRKKFIKNEWDKKYESIDKAYLENASIISSYGRICCISFGYMDMNKEKRISSYWGPDEKNIVNSFNEWLKKIERKKFKLCGFRILYFDIPWILHKLHKYDIIPADIIYPYSKKPWDMRIVDLADDWKGKFAWNGTFDESLYELGLPSPKDEINGSEVHRYYHDGMYDTIKKYCKKDVASCIDMAEKMYVF
jgi:3'-5' exonuclease